MIVLRLLKAFIKTLKSFSLLVTEVQGDKIKTTNISDSII